MKKRFSVIPISKMIVEQLGVNGFRLKDGNLASEATYSGPKLEHVNHFFESFDLGIVDAILTFKDVESGLLFQIGLYDFMGQEELSPTGHYSNDEIECDQVEEEVVQKIIYTRVE